MGREIIIIIIIIITKCLCVREKEIRKITVNQTYIYTIFLNKRPKKHLKNEQRSRDAAAKKS